MVYRLELKVTQGALKRFNHHWVVVHWDVDSNVSVIQLILISSICILYTILSRWQKLSRDYNPVSDDRASRINILEHKLLEPVLLSYDLSLKFLRRFVDFLGYSLSVAILGCHSLFLFSITFNLSANVYFLKYLLASLLIQVWYLLAGLYVTCTISCLFLML